MAGRRGFHAQERRIRTRECDEPAVNSAPASMKRFLAGRVARHDEGPNPLVPKRDSIHPIEATE